MLKRLTYLLGTIETLKKGNNDIKRAIIDIKRSIDARGAIA